MSNLTVRNEVEISSSSLCSTTYGLTVSLAAKEVGSVSLETSNPSGAHRLEEGLKMRMKRTKKEKKQKYDEKLCELLEQYTQILVCVADANVQSCQLQRIRKALRHDSILLMGKKTMMQRSMFIHAEKTDNNSYLSLITDLVGNVGLVFTKGDMNEIREKIEKYKVSAPARVGLVAPVDVLVPPGNTGLDPSQACLFQVLNIPTQIDKGALEIVAPVALIKKGEKVGFLEAALLAKLGIKPFLYGLTVKSIYDNGSVFSPEVVNVKENIFVEKFAEGVSNVAALSLGIRYPTLAGASRMFGNTWNKILPVDVERNQSFRQADLVNNQLKENDLDNSFESEGRGNLDNSMVGSRLIIRFQLRKYILSEKPTIRDSISSLSRLTSLC